MPQGYVRNPRTGRQIKVGGPTYNKLMEEGVNFALVAAPQVPEEFVKNPRTGKQIKVGGPTYNKLKKQGYFGAGPPPKKSPPKGSPKKPKRKSPKRRRTKGEFTVVELKKMLKEKGLPTTGKKADLMVRYQKALQTPAPPVASPKAKSPTPKKKSPPKTPPKNVRTGFAGTGRGKGGGKGLGLGAKGLGGKRRPRTPSPRTPSGSPPMRRNNPSPRSPSPSTPKRLSGRKSSPKRSPGRKASPKRSPGRKTPQKFDCPVCLDDVDEVVNCKKCKKGVCLECYKGIVGVNAKCPQCREPFEEKDIQARVSPRTLAKKMEKRKEFQKAIDDERTQFDMEIARQLQEQMNRKMNGGRRSPPRIPMVPPKPKLKQTARNDGRLPNRPKVVNTAKPRLKQTMRKPEYDAKPKKTVMRKVGMKPPPSK